RGAVGGVEGVVPGDDRGGDRWVEAGGGRRGGVGGIVGVIRFVPLTCRSAPCARNRGQGALLQAQWGGAIRRSGSYPRIALEPPVIADKVRSYGGIGAGVESALSLTLSLKGEGTVLCRLEHQSTPVISG